MKQEQSRTTINKHGMLYDLEDKVPAGQSVIYGVQYLVYFLAGSAIMPVIIGAYLGLDQAEIAQMLQRTFLLSGGISILQAILGHRYPIIGGLFMMLLGVIAPICTFFAAIPPAVGYSAMMIVFAMMLQQGIQEFKKVELANREGFIIGISFMIGGGIMFLSADAFMTLPQMLRYIVSNGLIMGLIVALLMEHVLLRKKPQ